GLPHGQISKREGLRKERARSGDEEISERARAQDPRRARRRRRTPACDAGAGVARMADGATRRHGRDRERDVARTAGRAARGDAPRARRARQAAARRGEPLNAAGSRQRASAKRPSERRSSHAAIEIVTKFQRMPLTNAARYEPVTSKIAPDR